MKAKNAELEKFKLVLDFKVKEIQKTLSPKEQMLVILSASLEGLLAEIGMYRSQYEVSLHEYNEMNLKFKAVVSEAVTNEWRRRIMSERVDQIGKDVFILDREIDKEKGIKNMIINLFHHYSRNVEDFPPPNMIPLDIRNSPIFTNNFEILCADVRPETMASMIRDFILTPGVTSSHLDHMFRMEKDVRSYTQNMELTKKRAHQVDVKANLESAMFIKELNELKGEIQQRQTKLSDWALSLTKQKPLESTTPLPSIPPSKQHVPSTKLQELKELAQPDILHLDIQHVMINGLICDSVFLIY